MTNIKHLTQSGSNNQLQGNIFMQYHNMRKKGLNNR